ncbi:MAG: DUF6240 domain-containing protein [Eubacteriales bacterium]
MKLQLDQLNLQTNNNTIQGNLYIDTSVKGSGNLANSTYTIDSVQNQLESYKENRDVGLPNFDVPALTKDQMIVMAHSMSGEDFQKMQEEGYQPGTLDADEFVTTLDKMKASLLEAGVEVAGFTDLLSAQDLEDIVGDVGRAAQIASKLEQANLPVTNRNISQVTEALEMASSLTELTEETIAYLVDNQLEPTIDEVYKAQYSSNSYATEQRSGYFQEPLKGYIGKKADSIQWDTMKPQIEKMLEESKLEITDETMNHGKWLLEKSILVTPSTLEQYDDLVNLELPKEEALLMQDTINALINQKDPKQANLVSEENQYEKAVTIKSDFLQQLEEVTSTRQLEEVRLMLTAQVSLECLKRGIELDLNDLAQTVEQLKEVERDLYQAYVSDEKAITDEQINQYREARHHVEQIPTMPVAIIGQLANRLTEVTLTDTLEIGLQSREKLETIQEKYEQVMTLPSREYGDSIQKAFQNVSDILEEMSLEDNQSNQKAVRILGYNNMPITEENILAVKEADLTLQRVLDKLTPKATIELIHNGVNPLESSLAEIEEVVSKVEDENRIDQYAKFLVQLDHKNEVTEEEKEAYIGIYRLLRQVEKSDGAVIGSIVNQGEEVNFKNILKAVRTSKKQGMDISIDSNVGELSESTRVNQSISSQIENYYNKVAQQIIDKVKPHYLSEMDLKVDVSLEQLKEMVDEKAASDTLEDPMLRYIQEDFQKIEYVEESVLESLMDYNQSVNFDNILANQVMMSEQGNYFKQLVQYDQKKQLEGEEEVTGRLADVMREVVDTFDDYDSAQKSYEMLTDALTETIEESYETLDLEVQDARELSFLYKQISLASNFAKEEQYEIPVEVDDQFSTMNVKIIHNHNQQPKVAIRLKLQEGGEVAAHFTIINGKVNGYLASKNEEQLAYMNQLQGKLEESLNQNGQEVGELRSFVSSTLDTQTFYLEKQDSQEIETKQLYQVAKQFIQATNSRREL